MRKKIKRKAANTVWLQGELDDTGVSRGKQHIGQRRSVGPYIMCKGKENVNDAIHASSNQAKIVK